MKRIKAWLVALLTLMSALGLASAEAQRGGRDKSPPPYTYWENRRDPPAGHEFRPVPDPAPRWDDRARPPPNWNTNEWALRRSWLLRHGHDVDDDAAVGLVIGAILGFALGAAVVDSAEQQRYAQSRLNDPGWIAYCARRYNSFDPYTGTYLGRDGLRHYCR
jgi:hypothetical protein